MKKLLGILVLFFYSSLQAAEPITFSNIKSRIKDIPEVAYNNTQNLLNSNRAKSNSVKLEIHVGPNTKLYFKDNEKYFKYGIALWANFKQPSKYGALFYSFKDKSWAASQYEKIIGRPDDGLIDAPCHNKRCSGANSGMENNVDIGLGVFGIYGKDRSDPYRKGAIQIHEYTHAAQAAHWIGKFSPNSEHQKISPCWIVEGQAHFAGLSASSSSFKKYKKIRKQQIKSHPVKGFTKFTKDTILEYYKNDIPRQCIGKPNYRLGYTLGLLTVEALSAIGGTESTMKIYEIAAKDNKNFNVAFKDVFGITWNEAAPILAEIVAKTRKK